MDNWPEAIRCSLVARDVALNPPIDQERLGRFVSWLPMILPNDLNLLMKSFDGFEDYATDPRSEISMWSSRRIEEHLRSTNLERLLVPIGDFFIGSELICATPKGEVMYADRDTKLASSLREFYSCLVAGDFDL
jgi:hypothetical protein